MSTAATQLAVCEGMAKPMPHQSLETTQRYMHLSQTAPREGIRALEAESHGGGVEAGRVRSRT